MKSITRSMVLGRALPDTQPMHPLPDQHLHTETCLLHSRIRAVIPGHPHVRCIEERVPDRGTRASSERMRKIAVPAMALVSLMIAGYLILTSPGCTAWFECDNPIVPYAAGMFILGAPTILSYGIFSNPKKGHNTKRNRDHR